MDKEPASLHTYLFSLCVNAAAAQATSTGSRQLKLTRRRRFPAERCCQVEPPSTRRQNRHKPAGVRPLAAANCCRVSCPSGALLATPIAPTATRLKKNKKHLADNAENKNDGDDWIGPTGVHKQKSVHLYGLLVLVKPDRARPANVPEH